MFRIQRKACFHFLLFRSCFSSRFYTKKKKTYKKFIYKQKKQGNMLKVFTETSSWFSRKCIADKRAHFSFIDRSCVLVDFHSGFTKNKFFNLTKSEWSADKASLLICVWMQKWGGREKSNKSYKNNERWGEEDRRRLLDLSREHA